MIIIIISSWIAIEKSEIFLIGSEQRGLDVANRLKIPFAQNHLGLDE